MADAGRIPAAQLGEFMADVFVACGVPAADARIISDVLLAADLRGIDSHGVNRLKPVYYDRLRAGKISPLTAPETVREGPTTAVIDGKFGMGHVIAHRAMELAIAKAKQYGLGAVAVRNSTHFGIAGSYALQAVDAGMLGFVTTNARPSIAPTFGVENMLGTNPLTFGIPTDEDFPFLLDCATSITQRGKIEEWEREGKTTRAGLVTGTQGEERTDTAGILRDLVSGDAALLPVGGAGEAYAGYKGYGYATVAEILSSALQSGFFLKQVTGMNVGHFFLAMDVAAFADPVAFRRQVGDELRALRAAKKAPGAARIWTAGEKEYEALQERSRLGIPVNASIIADLRTMRDELALPHRFPFD